MKKFIFVLIATISLTLFASCGKQSNPPEASDKTSSPSASEVSDKKAPETTTTTSVDTDKPNEPESIPIVGKDILYTLQEYKEENDRYTLNLKHPIITNIPDADKITDLIKNHIISEVRGDVNANYINETDLIYDINDFELKYANNVFASFRYEGKVTCLGKEYSTEFIRAVNVDLNEISIVESEAVISDIDKLKEIFLTHVFTIVPADNAELNNLSRKSLMAQYGIYTGYPEVYFALNNNALVLTVCVEDVDTLGGQPEFFAPVDSIGAVLTDRIFELTKGNK